MLIVVEDRRVVGCEVDWFVCRGQKAGRWAESIESVCH